MKKHTLRRCAAAFAACAVMASAMPVVQLTAGAAGNIISNSTFESGTSGWGTYKESGGACSLGTENGALALKVSSVGKVNYAVQVFYDIIPLYQNGVYRLKYDIWSSTDRFIEGMIQQNGGTYQAYTWKGLSLTSTPQTVDYEFTMDEETDIMAKLVFNCGIQEKYEGELPEHTIYIDNVSLELVDDSAVDYGGILPDENSINVNQLGYRPDSAKKAVLRNVNSAPTSFEILDANTGASVYTGSKIEMKQNSSADETDYILDFSEFKDQGKYVVKVSGVDYSYPFEISDSVYNNLLDESVKMLYLQRCGTQVNDADFGHGACHATMATVYGTNRQIDVTGGWHDAGDYGRYVVPGAKAVADLIYAYQADPSLYGDSTGIPESGNGVADILDEARFELEWMLKMQDDNGGVFHKVTCETFPGYVAPEKETAPLIVTPVSSTATADFCASMALAAEAYATADPAFSRTCLAAAEKAWNWLEQNPNLVFQNPEDIVTGEYGDKSDKDERYWAACQMYRATGGDKYLNAIGTASKGMDWATVGDYGNIAILTMPGVNKDSTIYQNAQKAITSQADLFTSVSTAQAYGTAISKYEWGSNMTIANAGIVLSLAYELTDNAAYKAAAESQLNYLLGTNPLGKSFVTGFGSDSPENPHHRPSMAAGKAMKGMLVGGVNQNLEDSAAKAYTQDQPAAKRYVDNSESYSTNEITIYWNSPLTYLLTLTNDSEADIEDPTGETPTTPDGILWGDANCSGDVKLNDAVLIMQAISNPNKYGINGTETDHITADGIANGDVYENGSNLTGQDALSIQKYLLHLINELPESYLNNDQPEPMTTSQGQFDNTTTTTAAATTTEQPTSPPPAETTVTTTVPDDYMNANADMVADFRKGESQYFYASDGWSNESCFNCFWHKENATFDNGVLNLRIDTDNKTKYDYSAGEYRTVDFYGYGYYETSMKAIKNDGVVSSFFTYTGPSDNNPWDEIDIEILGKDTTKVQFNYYTNGEGKHEYMYDLGFDASEAFHRFGFEWEPDYIAWFVDGKEVYRATSNIPSTPGRIMMNVWPGTGVDDWLNPYNGKTPLTASYEWVTYDMLNR